MIPYDIWIDRVTLYSDYLPQGLCRGTNDKGEIYMNTILKTEKLCKSFSNAGLQQHVIKNLDLEIYEKDFTVIMGASGSGKSTLLYALSGMDKPSMGKVYFSDTDISDYSNDQLAKFRREHCGFVFQSIYLLDSMNVLDNILTGALLVQKNTSELIDKVKALLNKVGIGEEMWKKYPNQLSGGECQRVGIVRAAINEPDILFADEPTGALNSSAGTDVLDVFTGLNRNGQSIVMVTHDVRTALRGNRVIYLKDGNITGEYKMSEFGTDDEKTRREGLQSFLNEQGW